ncbi:hypothetical protein HMPREF0880_00376 [Yokenella regensburgei ATCC 43003]|nr:hypothetical protein HMPREF0880_00376 [Yokenella regensburgei ATCC 43003]
MLIAGALYLLLIHAQAFRRVTSSECRNFQHPPLPCPILESCSQILVT